MYIVGIDPGINNIGIGVIDEDYNYIGSFYVSNPVGNKQITFSEKFPRSMNEFNSKLREIVGIGEIALFAVEIPVMKKGQSSVLTTMQICLMAGGLTGQTFEAFEGGRVKFIVPTSMKKIFTDDGSADKDKIGEYCKINIKGLPDGLTDHEHDALALAWCFRKMIVDGVEEVYTDKGWM